MTEAVKNNTLLKTQTGCSQTVSNVLEFQPLLFSFIWYKYTCLHDVSWAVFKGWFCEWGRRVYNWPNFNLQPSARPTKCAFKWRKLCFNISRIFTAKLNVFREWWLNLFKHLGLRFLVQPGDVRGSGRAFPLSCILWHVHFWAAFTLSVTTTNQQKYTTHNATTSNKTFQECKTATASQHCTLF